MCAALGLPNRIMVDCSHGNSSKDHRRQPEVFTDVVRQVVGGSPHVLGVMLESHLFAGNQRLEHGKEGLRYGVSITDACIDWPTTETTLRQGYAALQDAGIGIEAGKGRPVRRTAGN